MGESQSKLPHRPDDFEYMCIDIGSIDRVCITLGADKETKTIRHVIRESWRLGIQKETSQMNGVHQFKLNGSPFYFPSTSVVAATSRRMVGNILHKLSHDGWRLQVAGNFTQTTDFTTWIFKKDPVAVCPSAPFITVGFNSVDSLLVLNAPLELHQVFRKVIEKSWPKGIRTWTSTYANALLKIRLKGYPWSTEGEDTVHAIVLLHTLVNELFIRQWKLYGNTSPRSSMNTLFFEHNPTIELGLQPPSAHFTVSFSSGDLLRLIGIPESLVPAVRNTVQSFWPRGIQKDERFADTWQFKLRGTPWWASGEEAVDSTLLVLKLMETMQAGGWSVVANASCSRKRQDKCSLLFSQSQPSQSPFFCMRLNETDKLRLINAPEDVTKMCQDVIQSQYVPGVQSVQSYSNGLEFKLLSNPWSSGIDGCDGIYGRNVLCHLFAALAGLQWKPVVSADVSAKYSPTLKGEECPVDVDSIFFVLDSAAVPESSIDQRSAMAYDQPMLCGSIN